MSQNYTPAAPPTVGKRSPFTLTYLLVGAGILALSLLFTFLLLASLGRGVTGDTIQAYNKASDAVKLRLKSPASLRFSLVSETSFTGDAQYGTVKGWVEAKSQRGVPLRADFVVEIEDGVATVTSLKGR